MNTTKLKDRLPELLKRWKASGVKSDAVSAKLAALKVKCDSLCDRLGK